MNKIYVCQAKGYLTVKNTSFIFFILPLYFMYFASDTLIKTFGKSILFAIGMIYINGYFLYQRYMSIENSYLQIDSYHNSLIYIGKGIKISVKLKQINKFTAVEDGIIVNSEDRIFKIPFAEFKNVDLVHFTTSMNKVIKNNVEFHTILNEEDRIQGFNYLEGETMKQANKYNTVITNFWWSQIFPIVFIIITSIILILFRISIAWFIK